MIFVEREKLNSSQNKKTYLSEIPLPGNILFQIIKEIVHKLQLCQD